MKTVARWDEDYYHPIALRLYYRAISDMLRLMDVGCGSGVHSIRVAKAGFRVCAIDISETMLRHARQRVEKAGVLDAVEFYQKDLTQLDFADSSFRYAFSWGVIIHIPEVERALDELARIIKLGGKLALYLTNRTGLDYKIKSFARFILRKPLAGLQHLPLGDQTRYEKEGGRQCVWQFDAQADTDYLEGKGFHLLTHRIGELTEIHRHLKGFPRRSLLRINNLSYEANLPPSLATGNLLVFKKTKP